MVLNLPSTPRDVARRIEESLRNKISEWPRACTPPIENGCDPLTLLILRVPLECLLGDRLESKEFLNSAQGIGFGKLGYFQ